MKTRDFIKMLQDADPTGESHLRVNGYMPMYAELKEGYWDGSYEYLDDDGNFITSIENNKVDIHTYDINDFIEHNFDRQDVNNWENIKKKLKFEFDGYCNKEEKIQKTLDKIKKAYDDYFNMEEEIFKYSLDIMLKNAEIGWTWFQNKDENLKGCYHWKVYDENNKEMGGSIMNTDSVQYSKLWEKVDNNIKEGYYQWILK